MNKKLLVLLMCVGTASSMMAQRSITDTVFSVPNVDVLGLKPALQETNVELLNMDVPLKYLPITVTRLDAETMDRKHIESLEDAIQYLPGVVMSSNQLGAFQRYSIRGTTDAVVAYDGIRDDRSILNNVPFGDLSSVEAIEVIKGPASILSGHTVMGGVINIIRKKASPVFTANAKLSYGSWKDKQATVGFGGHLIGPINYRANIHYSNGDGYRMVNADRFSGLFAIGMEVTKKGYLEANISFNDDRYTTDIGGPSTMPGDVYYIATDELFAASGERNPLANYENVYNDIANNKMHRRNIDIMLDYKHELTRWMSLRERFSYGHSNLDYACVENLSYRTSTDPIYDWYYYRNGVKTYIEMDSVRSGDPLCFNPDNYSYTNTLELTGKIFTKSITHNYTLGWNYTFLDYTQYNGYNDDDVWGPGLNEMLSVENPQYVRDWWDSKVSAASIRRYITNGVYIHDVLDINDHWKGMLGLRFDTYNYKNASATIDDGRQHYDKANRTDWKSVRSNALTYRAGVVYLPIPTVSIYGSAASYFKPNTTVYNANYIYLDRNGNEFNPDTDGGQVFRPEKGYQLELGARYELSKILEVNASVYYIRKHNVVKTLGTKTVEEEDGSVVEKSVRAQVGRATSKGFDLDLTLRPVSTLQIVGGLGWSDYRTIASNLDWIPEDADWVTYNEDGSINLRATGVPRVTFYTYADYTIPKGIFKDLSFHLSGTFTDRIYTNIANNVYQPSRYIVDAGAFYTINKQIRLGINLYNIFDKKYYEASSSTRLAKPFHFMASISYHI